MSTWTTLTARLKPLRCLLMGAEAFLVLSFPVLAMVSTGGRNILSWREKMECGDGSEISSRVYYGGKDGVMGSDKTADPLADASVILEYGNPPRLVPPVLPIL
jgi:hypothetical protein